MSNTATSPDTKYSRLKDPFLFQGMAPLQSPAGRKLSKRHLLLALLVGVLDLPVHPLMVLGVGGDDNDDLTRPPHLISKDLLDVVGAFCVVRGLARDRRIPDLRAPA